MSETIAEDRTADRSPPLRSVPSVPRKLPLWSVVVVVGYVLIGLIAYWPLTPFDLSHHLLGGYGDYAQSVWFIAWLPHALTHGLNPFFSNNLFVPTGVNLAQNTESPLLGLAATPFTLAFGPVVGTNLLMLLAMPASATAAFVVLRRWRVWHPAAALGGLMYGFSPYMVGQSQTHLELLFVPLPPFIALTIASIVQRRGSPRRLGLQLGALVVAQYLISPEICAVVILFAVGAVACVALRNPATMAALARTMVRPVGIAVAVVAVLLAFPVWMLLAGPQHFTGPATPLTNTAHNDLLSFVIPGPLQKVSLGARALGAHLDGTRVNESGGYIGVPLLIVTGVLAWRSRRSPRSQLAVVLLLVAAILSLGPYLAIDGHLTRVPLPFLLLDHLPLANNILSIRICFELSAFLAAVIAFGLDDMHRSADQVHRHDRPTRRRRDGTVFVCVTLAVLMITQLPQWPNVAALPRMLPAALTRAIPPRDPITITYPYSTAFTMQPMIWQAENGFGFRLLGGYAYRPDANGGADLFPGVMRPPSLQRFLAGQDIVTSVYQPLYGGALPVTPELVASTRTTLSQYHVGLVIVDRSVAGSGPVDELFYDALGPPKVSADHFSEWFDWHGPPSHQIFPKAYLATKVVAPANGVRLSGSVLLDATAADSLSTVTNVDFLLAHGSGQSTLIAVGHRTIIGWFAKWKTSGVANGTYTLQTAAHDSAGKTSYSKAITVTVHN